MKKILFAPEDGELVLKEFFHFLYMTYETIHLFRFLYRNPSDLVDKYPFIQRGFKQLIKAKEKGFAQILNQFAKEGRLMVKPEQIVHLTELISMVLTQGLNYYSMQGEDIDDSDVIYRALATIFFAIGPHLQIDKEQIEQLQTAIANCSLKQQ